MPHNGWAMFSAALKHVLFKFASSQFVQRNIFNLKLIRQRRIGEFAKRTAVKIPTETRIKYRYCYSTFFFFSLSYFDFARGLKPNFRKFENLVFLFYRLKNQSIFLRLILNAQFNKKSSSKIKIVTFLFPIF